MSVSSRPAGRKSRSMTISEIAEVRKLGRDATSTSAEPSRIVVASTAARLPSAFGSMPTSRSWASNRRPRARSEEHTSELQSRGHLVCRLLLEKKKQRRAIDTKETTDNETDDA